MRKNKTHFFVLVHGIQGTMDEEAEKLGKKFEKGIIQKKKMVLQ